MHEEVSFFYEVDERNFHGPVGPTFPGVICGVHWSVYSTPADISFKNQIELSFELIMFDFIKIKIKIIYVLIFK